MSNELPGGGPNANVVAHSRQGNAPAPAPVEDPPKVDPNPVPVADTPKVDPASLSLEPAAPSPPADVEVPDFGDVGLNVAADYFVKLGLDLNGRELEEAGKGNFALLRAKLEVMGDKAKGSEGYVKLAEDAVARTVASAKAKGEQAVKDVHEAVGGEANWQAVRTWATTNLKGDELKQASDALNQGGFLAQAMARQLHSMAAQHPGVTVQGIAATNPNAVTEGLKGTSPLNPQEYRAAYKELVKKLGSITAAAHSDELKQLNARFQR